MGNQTAVAGKTIGKYYEEKGSTVEDFARAIVGKSFRTRQVGIPREYKVIGVKDARWTHSLTDIYRIEIEAQNMKTEVIGVGILIDDSEIMQE
jgi:hypothetical protein